MFLIIKMNQFDSLRGHNIQPYVRPTNHSLIDRQDLQANRTVPYMKFRETASRVTPDQAFYVRSFPIQMARRTMHLDTQLRNRVTKQIDRPFIRG